MSPKKVYVQTTWNFRLQKIAQAVIGKLMSQKWYKLWPVFKSQYVLVSYRICCLCAPTLYKKLQQIKQDGCEIYLFEYDKRFAVFGQDFVFYDYNDPLNIPAHIPERSFDVVFADPPFLTEECFTKVAKTVNYLMKDKLIICTGMHLIFVSLTALTSENCYLFINLYNLLDMNKILDMGNYNVVMTFFEIWKKKLSRIFRSYLKHSGTEWTICIIDYILI